MVDLAQAPDRVTNRCSCRAMAGCRETVAGGQPRTSDDKCASMDLRYPVGSPRPPEWRPLVSPRHWAILVDGLGGHPEVLDDLHVALSQLSPGVRGRLLANLTTAVPPQRAVWTALAATGQDARLHSAVALGRLDALGKDAPVGMVMPLWPKG